MAATLSLRAGERSTYVITATYEDEDGNPITPTTATWTLTDGEGKVVNSRLDVAIAAPSTSDDIVLQGDDLVCISRRDETRILTMEITYTSALGAGLPCTAQVSFRVANFVKVV